VGHADVRGRAQSWGAERLDRQLQHRLSGVPPAVSNHRDALGRPAAYPAAVGRAEAGGLYLPRSRHAGEPMISNPSMIRNLQRIMRRYLIHTCTFQRAAKTQGDQDNYGHEEISYAPPEVVADNVICLMQSLSIKEMIQLGFEGTIVGYYALYVLPQDVPDTLKQWTGSTDHQLV